MYRETLFDCQALLPASQAFASDISMHARRCYPFHGRSFYSHATHRSLAFHSQHNDNWRSPQSLVSCSSRCAWQRGPDVNQDQSEVRAV